MKVNSSNIAPSNHQRGLVFQRFQHRTPRIIRPFRTGSRGPLLCEQNRGAMLQTTYERVAPKHRMQNSLIFERQAFLPRTPVPPSRKSAVISYHSECPDRRLIDDTTCCGVHRQHTQFAVAFRILLYLATYADIVHMRTPRTCTPLPLFGGAGLAGFVACHSAFAASPGPFRRELRPGTCPFVRFAR